jgi:hypothetical protein
MHRCSICPSRFFHETEPDMSTTRWQAPELRAIALIWVLAAALLAGACGGGSSEPVLNAGSPKFYALGGTISGLTRPGLVLTDGTNTVSVAANTTTFTLPVPVAYTDAYAVTVATQPAGLTCSVSKGSGAAPASNVMNVKVRCLDDSRTVGGTAKGLNGKGLVWLLSLAQSTRFSPL